MQQTSVVLLWCDTKQCRNRSCFSSKLLLLTGSSVALVRSHLGSMPARWWPAGAVFHLMIVWLRTKWKYVKTGTMCDQLWVIITAVLWLQRYFLAPASVTQIGMNKLRLHLKWDEQADILILATLTFPTMANWLWAIIPLSSSENSAKNNVLFSVPQNKSLRCIIRDKRYTIFVTATQEMFRWL